MSIKRQTVKFDVLISELHDVNEKEIADFIRTRPWVKSVDIRDINEGKF